MDPVDLFYSYAHEDEKLRDELDGHLALLRRKGVIRPWHDRGIVPGQKWDEAIDAQLSTADLILLLVSMDFLNSDYIWGKELATALPASPIKRIQLAETASPKPLGPSSAIAATA